jgi:hypothetical protein
VLDAESSAKAFFCFEGFFFIIVNIEILYSALQKKSPPTPQPRSKRILAKLRASTGVPNAHNAYMVGFHTVINIVAEFAQLKFSHSVFIDSAYFGEFFFMKATASFSIMSHSVVVNADLPEAHLLSFPLVSFHPCPPAPDLSQAACLALFRPEGRLSTR